MTEPTLTEALPDLTLRQCMDRWRIRSTNAVKARAASLGVQLRRESSTRTVWPAGDLPLGDRLNDHLQQPGANLRNFPEALPPEPRYLPNEPALMAPAAGTDDMPPLSLPAPAAGSDGPAMLAALLAALTPAPALPQPPDPLAVARGLSDAAGLGAWLTTAEMAQLLRVSPGTVRSWGDGHQPRPGFRLERRRDGSAVWWRVTAVTS
jgi:hypothetical protein